MLSSIAVVAGTGCDIPTSGPDFGFTPTASAPVVFEKTFVFLGPDGSGIDALIDTTSATFDSIFTVDPLDGGVYVVKDLEAFDLIDIDDVVDPIRFDPENIVVTIGDLASQHLETSYEDRLGVLEIDGTRTPPLTPDVSTGRALLPVAAGDLLSVPTSGLIDLTGAEVELVSVTSDGRSDLNLIHFTLANSLDVPLIAGSSAAGSTPDVVLESGAGIEIARASFDRAPSPGETAAAALSLSGLDVPADGRFALDVTTPSGFGPIAAEPARLGTALDATPIRYWAFRLSDIPATTAAASRAGLTLATEVDLAGATTRGGYATVAITNTLPLPLQIERLSVVNDDPVASYPSGHQVVDRPGPVIPPNTTVSVPVSIGTSAISRTVSVVVSASAPYTATPTDFSSSDGLAVVVAGDVDVDELFYRPDGEIFSTETAFTIGQSDITFATSADYAQVESGSLDVLDLLNGMDLSFDDVTISFPDILIPPYGPEDTLVVAFRGATDRANGREFSKIDRNEPPRSVSVDLAGARITPIGNQVRYRVAARSEAAQDIRMVVHDDEISGHAATSDLRLAQIAAFAEPFSADLTEDANGDGLLDPTAGEGATNTMDDFGPLDEVSGLELGGAELSVNLTATMAGDLVLYGILVGENDAGNTIYLQGRGEMAVSPSDTLLQSFRIGGVLPGPEQMFALPITVEGSADQSSAHTVVLTDGNSNISEFVNARPTTLRFVGKALVGTPGGRLELRQPATVDVSVGIAVPLNVRGDFEVDRTEPANLSALAELTDPDATFTAEAATLTLAYTNGIPLGLRARIEFMDDTGSPTVALPLEPGGSIELAAAPTDANGYASGESSGETEFGLADDALRRLSDSDDLRIVLSFGAPAQASGRIRATDRVSLSLRGDFRFNVTVGN